MVPLGDGYSEGRVQSCLRISRNAAFSKNEMFVGSNCRPLPAGLKQNFKVSTGPGPFLYPTYVAKRLCNFNGSYDGSKIAVQWPCGSQAPIEHTCSHPKPER